MASMNDVLHRHEVAQDPMLWAAYAAQAGITEAVDLWYGRRRLDSLTAQQWQQL